MNPTERREFAQLMNDLALDLAERLLEERQRHEQADHLLRGTLERQQREIRELKDQIAREETS